MTQQKETPSLHPETATPPAEIPGGSHEQLSSGEEWLAARLGTTILWAAEQKQDVKLWAADQADKGAEWRSTHDLRANLNRAEIDVDAQRNILSYTEKADPAELIGEDFDGLWDKYWFRWAMTKKVRYLVKDFTTAQRNTTAPEKQLIKRTLEAYGMDSTQAADTWRAWRSYSVVPFEDDPKHDDKAGEASDWRLKMQDGLLERNFSVLEELQQEDPESVAILYKDFGIRNFGRYHSQTLLGQARDLEKLRDNPKLAKQLAPDEVVLSGTDDWNGALRKIGKVVSQTQSATSKKGKKRHFFEARERDEAKRYLQTEVEHFGPIEVLATAAHGNEKVLALSDTPEGYIGIDDIRGDNGEPPFFDGILAKGGHATLFSCDTGHPEAIGEVIADVHQVRTSAPAGKPNLDSTHKRFGRAAHTYDRNGERMRIYGPNRVHAATYRTLGRLARLRK
jgi:hypothetical protein